jgi:hypothetical protein
LLRKISTGQESAHQPHISVLAQYSLVARAFGYKYRFSEQNGIQSMFWLELWTICLVQSFGPWAFLAESFVQELGQGLPHVMKWSEERKLEIKSPPHD